MTDFDAVQDALVALGATADAAESHGTLCALLLAAAPLETWLGHTLQETPAAADVLARERLGVLQALYLETRTQLDDGDLGLALLLPADDADFAARLQALAGWCQGFLYGLGVAGLAEADGLDEDTREGLSDLLEISKLDVDEDGDDEAEQQFAHLVEHVRLVTLMLNESLNPLERPPTLH